MTAVVDPASLGEACFGDPLYAAAVVQFVIGIQRNGVLIVDADGVSRNALLAELSRLGSRGGRNRVVSGMVDLLKTDRRLVQIGRSLIDARSYPDPSTLARSLYRKTFADALLTTRERLAEAGNTEARTAGTLTFGEYPNSELEARRRQYADGPPPLSDLTEVDLLLSRGLRLARWVNLYDRQLGRGTGISRFREGVGSILRLWRRYGLLVPASPKVNIYTGAEPGVGVEQYRICRRRIERELIERLEREHGVAITLHCKDDPQGIFHARFIETPYAILRLDPGLDYRRREPRIILSVDNNCGSLLNEIRSLRDVYYPLLHK